MEIADLILEAFLMKWKDMTRRHSLFKRWNVSLLKVVQGHVVQAAV
jgi:hypothetical protein